MSDKMTKTDRAELRSVTRQQFRVLRSEVDQRAAEMHAEAAEQIHDVYADIDALRADLEAQALEIAQKAARDVVALLRAHPDAKAAPSQGGVSWAGIQWQSDGRYDLKGRAALQITKQARDARTALDRQEADILRELAVDALESEAARAWLSNLPTAAALVPAFRLRELEAQFNADD